MKRLILVPLLALAAFATQAQGHDHRRDEDHRDARAEAVSFRDEARVIRSVPQTETVMVPRQECRNEWVVEQRPIERREGRRDAGGAVVGGVVGAILGNQIGEGQGRAAATALGAAVGAVTGERLSQRDRAERVLRVEEVRREVTTCRTVEEAQTRVTGYLVDYEFHGRRYTTLMDREPGRFVPVQVSVALLPL